jgi:hypothetical protein
MLALYSAAHQFARVCRAGEAPELEVGLSKAVTRLSDYVVANGGRSRADVEQFMLEQGGAGKTAEALCRGAAAMLYEALSGEGPQALQNAVDAAVARPGKPTWDTCV